MKSSSQGIGRVVAGIVGAVLLAGVAVAVMAPPRPHGATIGATARATAPARPTTGDGVTPIAPKPAGPSSRAGSTDKGASSAPGPRSALGSVGAPAGPSSAVAGPTERVPSAAAGSPTARIPLVGPSAPQPAPPADTVVRSGTVELQVAKGGFSSAFSAAADVARQMGGFVLTAQMGPTSTTMPIDLPVSGNASFVGPPSHGAPAVVHGLPSVGDQGRTGAASATDSGPPTSGTLEIRVPGARFDDARRQLEGLGRVRQEQLSGQDAGGQLADFGARLTDLHAEQDGLRAMAAKAATSADLLAVQAQLAAVQQQIDGLTAQLNTLNNQVALAAITVSVHEPVLGGPGSESVLSTRLAQAGRGVEAVLGGILVVLAYGAPVGLLAGVGAAVIVGQRRRRLSRASIVP